MPIGGMRVLVDANVLWPRALRDWILMMSDAIDEQSPYTICWTEDILAETVARMRDENPHIDSKRLEEIGDRLRKYWKSSRISGFPACPESFIGQDEGDLHLHSAAVAGDVDMIVTNDKKGLFPPADRKEELNDLTYEIYRADKFLILIHEQAPMVVRTCCRRQLKHYIDHGEMPNLVTRLQGAGAPQFAEKVRWVLQSIDMDDLDC